MDDAHLDAIADAYPHPYWYDDVDQPESNPMLVRTDNCDLCVVGGGSTGLWTARNAQERFADEMPALERLGLENLNQIEAAIGRYGIDCDYERTGVIDIAIDQSMVMELR